MSVAAREVVTRYRLDTTGVTKQLRDMAVSAKSSATSLAAIDKATQTTAANTSALAKTVASATGYLKTFIGLKITGFMLGVSDAAANLQQQISSVSANTVGFSQAFRDLKDLTISVGGDISSLSAYYAQLGQSIDGISHSDIVGALDLASTALVKAGASTASVNAVMRQFTQGLSSGKVQGEELISIMEGAPPIMIAWANAMGKGAGEIKKLSAAGQFTTASFFELRDSIQANLDKIQGSEPVVLTFGRALNNLKTRVIALVVENKGLRETMGLAAKAVEGFGILLDELAPAFAIVGNSIEAVSTGLANLGKSSSGIDEANKSLKELKKTSKEIEPSTFDVLVYIFEVELPAAFAGAIPIIKGFWDVISENATFVLEVILQSVENTILNIESSWWTIVGTVSSVFNNIASVVASAMEAIANKTIDVLNALASAANDIPFVDIDPISHIDVKPIQDYANFMDYAATKSKELDRQSTQLNATMATGRLRVHENTVAITANASAQSESAAAAARSKAELNRLARQYPDLVKETYKATKSTNDHKDSVNKNAKATKGAGDAAKEYAKELKEVNKVVKETGKYIDDYRDKLEEQIKTAQLSDREKAIYRTESELTKKALELEGKAVDALAEGNTRLAETYRKSAAEVRAVIPEMVELSAKAYDLEQQSKGLAAAWDESIREVVRSIQGDLADAFYDLFTGVSNGASSFLKSLKEQLLKGLSNIAAAIVQQPINVVINGVIGSVSGSATASVAESTVSSVTGSSSSLSSIFSAGGNLTKLLNLFSSSSFSVGATLGNFIESATFETAFNEAGTYIAQGLTQTSNLALIGGGIAGGIAASFINSSLFGDSIGVQIGGAIGSTVGSVAGAAISSSVTAAIGAEVGTAVFPVIGTAIGAIIGGVAGGWFGSLFGSDPNPRASFDFTSEGYINSWQSKDWKQAGLSKDTLSKIKKNWNESIDGLRTLFTAIGVDVDEVISGIKFNEGRIKAGDISGYLDKKLNEIIDALIAETPELYQKYYESVGRDITAFAENFEDLTTIIQTSAIALGTLDPKSYQTVDQVVEALGKLNTAELAPVASGLSNLSTVLDTLGIRTSTVSLGLASIYDVFASRGEQVPTTIAEFKALYDSIDLTTASGIRFAAAIGELGTHFTLYLTYSENLANAMDAISTATGNYRRQLEKSAGSLVTLLDTFYSESKKTSIALDLVSEAFDSLDLKLPATRQAFDDLLNSLDPVVAKDRQVIEVLSSIVPELQIYVDTLGEQADVTEDVTTASKAAGYAIQDYVDALLSVQSTLDSTRSSIFEFGLSSETLYNMRKAEADALLESLRTMTDPVKIESTVSEIDKLIQSGWGLLDETQKSALKDQFLSYLDEVEALAEAQLAKGVESILPESADTFDAAVVSFANAISEMNNTFGTNSAQMSEAANSQEAAAAQMIAAANTIQSAALSIPTQITVVVKQSELV